MPSAAYLAPLGESSARREQNKKNEKLFLFCRIIEPVRAEQQTCLIVMPSAADNLEETAAYLAPLGER